MPARQPLLSPACGEVGEGWVATDHGFADHRRARRSPRRRPDQNSLLIVTANACVVTRCGVVMYAVPTYVRPADVLVKGAE